MTRPLLALALALTTAATGCGDGDDPPGDVTLYWGFVRNTVSGPVLYDAQDPGGSIRGQCEQSGVEYVRVTTLEGRDIDPVLFDENLPIGAIPCVYEGVHGLTFRVVGTGTQTWNVTGYRTVDGLAIPVAQSTTTFDVRPDRVSEVIVDVQPIQDDVQLTPVPWNNTNTAEMPCAESGIAETDVFLWTFAGDPVVDQTVIGCAPVTFRLDRDDYEVRMRGFAASTAVDPTHDSNASTTRCEAIFITQLGPDGGGLDWLIDLRFVAIPGAALCP